jgi:hypothetical protein
MRSQETIRNIAESPQLMSECARIGYGSLIQGLSNQKSSGNFFDKTNVQAHHEHIFSLMQQGKTSDSFPIKKVRGSLADFMPRLHQKVAFGRSQVPT